MMQDFGNRLLFQLALTTECIRQIFRFSNCFNSFNSHSLRSVSAGNKIVLTFLFISTRTLYGVYPSVSVVSLRPAHFNSHPLRSVSGNLRSICGQQNISTRTLYGVYRAGLLQHARRTDISTRTLYGVYQQNCLILCFQICHFLLHN